MCDKVVCDFMRLVFLRVRALYYKGMSMYDESARDSDSVASEASSQNPVHTGCLVSFSLGIFERYLLLLLGHETTSCSIRINSANEFSSVVSTCGELLAFLFCTVGIGTQRHSLSIESSLIITSGESEGIKLIS